MNVIFGIMDQCDSKIGVHSSHIGHLPTFFVH